MNTNEATLPREELDGLPQGWANPRNLPEHLKSHLVRPDDMAWSPTGIPGIDIKILFSDPTSGMSTALFRFAPGAVAPLHVHAGLEQTFIIEGSLGDDDGTAHTGDYVWRPAGNVHIAHSEHGCIALAFFTKPNQFAATDTTFAEKVTE